MRIACLRRMFDLTCVLSLALTASAASKPLGIFENHQDVGTVLHPGSATYDRAQDSYTIAGSGDNMWFGEDDFQFAWTKMSGDIALTADIAFVGTTGNNHRKAVLMIRQTLDGNSKSVDVARHGDGLTSLQFRDETNPGLRRNISAELVCLRGGSADEMRRARGKRRRTHRGPDRSAGGARHVEGA